MDCKKSGALIRKLASLKQYGLVRLASQAVPSLLYESFQALLHRY